MGDRLTLEEIIAWREYLNSEPRGFERDKWHAAQICKSIHDISRMFAKSSSNIPLEKFILKFERNNLADGILSLFGRFIPPEKQQKIRDKYGSSSRNS